MAEARWYVSRNGKVLGPYTQSDIVRMQRDGKLTGEVYVCEDGGEAWVSVTDCEWLKLTPAADSPLDNGPRQVIPPAIAPSPNLRSAPKASLGKVEESYPKLRMYLGWMEVLERICLWLGMGGCVLLALASIVQALLLMRYSLEMALFQLIFGLFASTLLAILCYIAYVVGLAAIEFVHVFIDIERNTRQLVELQRRPPPA